MTTIKLHAGKGINMISKYLYGHFAEHLGRCIYDGIYVGKIRRFRTPRAFATTS